MQCWNGVRAAPSGFGPSVVTIGSYDGVHRGHQRVVACAVDHARTRGVAAVVLTFDPHPLALLRPESAPALLTDRPQKARLMAAQGVDATCFQPFTPEFSQLSPEQFVVQVLLAGLRAAEVVVGANFRFGHRAAGDVATLTQLGARHGFAVTTLEVAGDGGRAWSSSVVRDLLAAGDTVAAAGVLGRPHRVEGPVVRGDGRGRELGCPTANLGLPAQVAIPADGVYAGWLVRDLEGSALRLPAAISVGTNPTFDGQQRRVEAYVITHPVGRRPDNGGDLDLYDETVGVEFALRLRGMVRFDTVGALVEQMARDVEATARVLG